jgi:hypothetical protein
MSEQIAEAAGEYTDFIREAFIDVIRDLFLPQNQDFKIPHI